MNRLISGVKVSFFLLVLISFQFSCNNDNKETNTLESQLSDVEHMDANVSKEELNELLESFPSAIEMAMVIKNENNEFSSHRLINTENSERFSSSYEKAMAIGAFGSDMGYLNIYEEVFLSSDYLSIVRALSVDLDLDGFFDFKKMIEMSKSTSNIDSLIQLTTDSFNEMATHLKEKGRDGLSVMMVFGMWLEGAYVLADIASVSQTETMYNRVAEQKLFIDKLSKLLSSSQDNYFLTLNKKIENLAKLYADVKIELIIKEPSMEEVDGKLVFIDNSETKIIATNELLKSIIAELISLRNELLN